MTNLLHIFLFLVLSGCVNAQTVKLNMTNCDPKIRDDCWAVTEEIVDNYIEIQEALHTCQQRL